MYKILLNGKDNIENILEGTLNLSANHVGTFTFSVDPTNPFYKVQELSDNISVLDHNNNYIFDGRILDTTTSFNNVKTVFCESSFAYLNDSVVLPYDYQGTLEGYIDMLLEMHNNQSDRKILKGNILVKDKNDYIHYSDINGPKTMETIQNKIIKRHGGFMFIRRVEDTNYLDYLNKTDFVKHCGQDIELGENLMDVNKERKGSEVYTVIYPTGARPEEDVDAPPINIASVNNGSLFIEDAEAIKKYGRIVRAVNWDRVYEPIVLKRKAENMLKSRVTMPEKLTLSALDLSQVASLDSFHLLDHVNVKSSAHDLDQDFIIYKQEIDLINPKNNIIDLSSIEEAEMTGTTSKSYSDLEEKLVENDSVYRKAQEDLAERISKASGMYQSKVSTESGEFYYLHDKEELKDSKTVLAINNEAVSLSTDGGTTWNTGLKFNGETITRILKAEGIDASWIRTGEFSLIEGTFQTAVGEYSSKLIGGSLKVYSNNRYKGWIGSSVLTDGGKKYQGVGVYGTYPSYFISLGCGNDSSNPDLTQTKLLYKNTSSNAVDGRNFAWNCYADFDMQGRTIYNADLDAGYRKVKNSNFEYTIDGSTFESVSFSNNRVKIQFANGVTSDDYYIINGLICQKK